jgi:hypothetical protein
MRLGSHGADALRLAVSKALLSSKAVVASRREIEMT